MKRPPTRCLASLLAAVLIGSCMSSDDPTGLGLSVAIPINPALIPSPADGSAAPINRIRARAITVAGGTIIGETVQDVSPTEDQWELTLDVTVAGESAEVMIEVYLINASGDAETVEFSGLHGPMTIEPGASANVADIPIVRGPIANHFVTDVTITSVPETLLEGATATVSADASTTGESDPSIYWTVLDSAILSSTGSVVTALAPGDGRIVASAGAHTDTASIGVSAAPAEVLITPDSTSVVGIGAQATYQATVLDARADPIPNAPIGWRSGTPSIIESLGGGLFEALAPGRGIVEAYPESDPTVVGSAVMRVEGGGGGPDVFVVASADDTTPAEGNTVQVTVQVHNGDVAGAVDVTGVVVQNAVSDGMTVLASAPGQGSFDAGTGLWTVGDLAIAGSALLALDVEIPLGSAGQTLTDSVWVASLDQTQTDLSNDTASVSFAVDAGNIDVEVLKTVDDPQPLPDATVTFTVSVVNHGPREATDIAVFDTLESASFLTPYSHEVSAGSLVGDSLWTIPALAVGATATWTTTATVAAGVEGGSATNTALLRSLTQSDTVPENNSAVVSMTFPTSGVPDVQITAPADGSVFDPGDLVDFTAVATDPEEGDLSPSIQWTSSLDGAIGTGRAFSTPTLSTGVHTIDAEVTDADGGVGADTIQVSIALYTVPPTLNVPFGGTASLPITLSEPAPPGGVTLTVVSDDESITVPTSPTVAIAEGALSANATLQGLVPGTANVTVSNPAYGPAVTVASVTAELDILGGAVSFAEGFSETITIQLESQGTPIAAPAGGLDVGLASRDPTCVSVTASITIPAGQIDNTAALTYGGGATLTCQTYVVATSSGVTSDSVLVSVTPMPGISISARTVGAGLQEPTNAVLGVGNHGGVTVRLTSSDPGAVLVSPDANTAGTEFIDLFYADGVSNRSFYVQGVEGAVDIPLVTATAPGFSDGSVEMNVVQPGLALAQFATTTTTLSGLNEFYALVGTPAGNSVNVQNVRAGGSPISVTFATDNTAVGVLTDGVTSGASVTADIPVGIYYTPTTLAAGGVAHQPLDIGTATISASAPGLITQPNGSRSVTVSAPTISLPTRIVGTRLQAASNGVLSASAHGGTTVTVTSGNSELLLVSPDENTPGTPSIDIDIPDGSAFFSYYVQGVGSSGTVDVTAAAPGFTEATVSMSVVQPGVVITALSTSTSTSSEPDEFYAIVGTPTTNSVNIQSVRAGEAPITVTFDVDPTSVGTLTDGVNSGVASVSATIQPGLYYTPTTLAAGGVAFEAVEAGAATVVASVPGMITQPNGTQNVTVTSADISLSSIEVGSGLQVSTTGFLSGSGHGGTTVTVTSGNAAVLLVSPDQTTPGTASIDIDVPDGAAAFTYFIQGVEGATGDVDLTAAAPGFVDGTATMSVVQPGVVIAGLTTSTTTLAADDDFYAIVGTPAGNTVNIQNVRAGGSPITVDFDIDDTGVALLTDGVVSGASVSATIPVGLYYTPITVAAGGVALDAVADGTATVVASGTGLTTQPAGSQTVTVTAPMISLNPSTVGSGLQVANVGGLNASAHGGVTVTITSSDPGTALVSPNSSTPGTASIDIVLNDGISGFSYYVQGVEGVTGNVVVTATADGFLDGSSTASVVQPGIVIVGLSATTTAGAANDDFYAVVGAPSGNSVNVQNVRAGGAPITVTATTSNPDAAELLTQNESGASVTAVIPVEFYYTPTTFSGGGFTLDPLAEGQTTVVIAADGIVTQPNGTVVVTINP